MRTKRSRVARWLTATVALALSLTLLTTAPASAGWADSPPPNSGGGSGNNGDQGGSGQYACGQNIGQQAGTLYYKIGGRWFRWWEYGWKPCVGQGSSANWKNTGVAELCSTGFLVYPFYGSANNPAQAVTRSRVNNSQWCAGEGTSFPATNPLDAGVGVNAPWRATEEIAPDQYYNGSPSYTYFRNDVGQLTTTWPTNVSGSCTALQSTSTIRAWFNKASENEQIALRAALGTDYWIVSEHQRGTNATALAEAGLASATGYTFSWAQWTATPESKSQPPAWAPPATADGYYLTSFTFEDRSCASPFQFLNSAATNAADRTAIGTCYVPLVRQRTQLRNSRTGAISWKWPTLQHDFTKLGFGAGERISTYYRGTTYTPSGPGGDSLDARTLGLSAAQQSQLITGWRNAMVADYRNWWNQGLTGGNGAQIVPVNAYTTLGSSNVIDQGAAAQELFDSARCRVGTSITFDAPAASAFPDVQASLDVTVLDHEVLQVSPNTVQIKVTAPAQPLCAAAGCPAGVALKSLSWSASVTGTAGYRLYAASDINQRVPVGYDGIVVSKKVAANGIVKSETFTVRFLHPTATSQSVRLTLKDLDGTYRQTTTTDGLRIEGYSPISGAKYSVDTGKLQAEKISPLPITASGSPRPLTRSGSAYVVDIPVVGAVQVPAG